MKQFFSPMYDCPEKTMSMAGLAYGMICFFTFPFLMLFFSQGFTEAGSLSWFEIVYHAFNFYVAVYIFRDYLKDSFFNVQYNLKPFFTVVAECSILMIAYAVFILRYGTSFLSEDAFLIAANGALPIVEMELFNLSSNLIYVNPVVGTICVVLFAPVTISCLYYASGFAPVCNNRPWLAYIIVAVVVAIPRICNALTFWPPAEEFMLYLAQLPLHLIACAAYHKADTIWAPIAVHMISNTLSCISLFLYFQMA